MRFTRSRGVVAGALICGLSGVALGDNADVSAQLQQLQAQMAQMRATNSQLQNQVDALKAGPADNWLTEARAEQVKGLVRDVLADADTRASLLDGGMTAGVDPKKNNEFFLASDDGNFRLNIHGQFDFRYIYDKTDNGTEQNQSNFQLRRSKIILTGNAQNPDLTYKLQSAFNRSGGALTLEEAWVDYKFADGWHVRGGQFTEPFLREFIVSSGVEQAVERSLLTQYMTGEFTKGVYLSYTADQWRALAGITGGTNQANTDFNTSAAAYQMAFIGRGEVLLAGKFDEFNDFAAWSTNEFGVMLGGGINYNVGANGFGIHKDDVLKYTADVSAKLGMGVNVFAALEGQRLMDNGDSIPNTTKSSRNQIGGLVQAGVFVVPDKVDIFGRYEYANLERVTAGTAGNTTAALAYKRDKLNVLTAGGNYYFYKHQAKFTLDVLYFLDPIDGSVASSGAGVLPDTGSGQVAVRAQFQLLF